MTPRSPTAQPVARSTNVTSASDASFCIVWPTVTGTSVATTAGGSAPAIARPQAAAIAAQAPTNQSLRSFIAATPSTAMRQIPFPAAILTASRPNHLSRLPIRRLGGAGNDGSADRASKSLRACCELDLRYYPPSRSPSPIPATMNDVTSRVEQIAARAAALYSRPTVALEIVRLTSEPQVDPRVLKELLEKDPALTCKMLRVVNSSFFGLRRRSGRFEPGADAAGQQAAAAVGARLQPAGRVVRRDGGRAARVVLADDAHAGRRRPAARHRALATSRATRRSSPA